MAYDRKTDRIYQMTADFPPCAAFTAGHPRPRLKAIPGAFTPLLAGC